MGVEGVYINYFILLHNHTNGSTRKSIPWCYVRSFGFGVSLDNKVVRMISNLLIITPLVGSHSSRLRMLPLVTRASLEMRGIHTLAES